MSRPAPKKSALSGSPIAPAPAAQPPQAAPEPPQAAPEPPPAEPAQSETADEVTSPPASKTEGGENRPSRKQTKAKKPATKEKKTPLPKTAFYQDPEAAARMRAAYLHTVALEGYSSLSAFIAQAVDKQVRDLERKYNDGEPWTPIDAGTVPTGRPPRLG